MLIVIIDMDSSISSSIYVAFIQKKSVIIFIFILFSFKSFFKFLSEFVVLSYNERCNILFLYFSIYSIVS